MSYRRRHRDNCIQWEQKEAAETALFPWWEFLFEMGLTALVVALFGIAALGMFLDVFTEITIPISDAVRCFLLGIPMVLALAFVRKAVTVRTWMVVGKNLLPFGYLGFYGYTFLKNEEILLQGSAGIAQYYVEQLNYYYKTNFSLGKITCTQEEIRQTMIFWFGLLFVLFLAEVVWCEKRMVMAILPLAVLVAELLVGRSPEYRSLSLFGLALLLANAGGWERPDAVEARGTGKGSTGKSFLTKILLVGLVCLLAGILSKTIEIGWGEKADALALTGKDIQNYERMAEDALKSGLVGIEQFFRSDKKESVNNRTPYYTDEEMLVYSMSSKPKGSQYLKDFHGVDYRGGAWISDDSDFEEECLKQECDGIELTKLLRRNLRGISSSTILSSSSSRSDVNCRVQYTGLSTSHVYYPYFANVNGWEAYTEFSDLRLRKKNSQKELEFEAWDMAAVMNTLSLQLSLREELGLDPTQIEWYDTFVKEHYLQTSEEVVSAKVIAEEILDQTKYARMLKEEQTENIARLGLAQKVAKYLSSGTYSLELPRIPGGMDAVEYFLSTTKMGYCVHFASAGVLILREMGVPARYASGYIVKEDTFRMVAGEYQARVPDSSAHAWVEVYLNDLGWVPVEMTPAYMDEKDSSTSHTEQEGLQKYTPEQDEPETETETVSSEEEESSQTDDKNQPSEETDGDTEISTESTNQKEENPDVPQEGQQSDPAGAGTEDGTAGGSAEDGSAEGLRKEERMRIGWWVAGIAAAILIVGVFLYSARQIYRNRELMIQSDLRRHRNRRAVRTINRYLYQKLKTRHLFTLGYPSDVEFREHLIRQFPQISPEDWNTYMDIVRMAVFSRREVPNDQAQFCYGIYQKVRFLEKKDSD